MRRAFVYRVLAVWALARTFSVLLLTIVSHYQPPVAWDRSPPELLLDDGALGRFLVPPHC